jgi:multidrug efflux system membrane fusion protein
MHIPPPAPPSRTSGSGSFLRPLFFFTLIAIAGYVLFRVFFTDGAPQNGANGMGPVPVSVAPVITRDVTMWKEFSGRLEAIDTADVRARVSGPIERIYFKDGAQVTRGQPLFLIDPRPYQAEVTRAQGEYAAAQAELATARRDAARADSLRRANAIAKVDFDERVNRVRTAQGNAQRAQGTLDAAKLNLQFAEVKAPITGRASRAELTIGNLVDAGPNAPILTTIVSQDPLYVSFEADEQTFLSTIRAASDKDRLGIPVEMGLADDRGTPHKGRIHSFDNRLDVASGTIRVRAVFDNKTGDLIPGLYAKVRVGTPQPVTSLLINERAISTDQTSKFVYVVEDGKVAYRPVTLGANIGELRQVISGVKAGETIIVGGIAKLRPGIPVQPMPVDMTTLKGAEPQPQTTPQTEPKS